MNSIFRIEKLEQIGASRGTLSKEVAHSDSDARQSQAVSSLWRVLSFVCNTNFGSYDGDFKVLRDDMHILDLGEPTTVTSDDNLQKTNGG
jgi:hypothetical protein